MYLDNLTLLLWFTNWYNLSKKYKNKNANLIGKDGFHVFQRGN